MNYFADVRALARKDLLLELRARDTLPAMLLFVVAVFVVFHVSLVFIAYPKHNVTNMVFGEYLPERFAVGLVIMLTMIAAVIAFWLWASYWSHRDLRCTQVLLNTLEEPIRALFVNRLKSRQRGRYTERDISPYHWSNGRHPTPEESPEWEALRQNDWQGYELEVGGLTDKTIHQLPDAHLLRHGTDDV